jgi:hypothetical protein
MNYRESKPEPIVQSWIDLAAENRGSGRFHVSYTAFRSILRGYAPTPEELSGMTPLDPDEARELVVSMLNEGRLRARPDDGRIAGAGGLSLDPARQSLTIDGRTFGTWCALDVVGIPAGLEVDAHISATCDDTGEPVSIKMADGRIVDASPSELLISLVPASVARSVYTYL